MALTNIVANDGATTPVSHTFVGISAQISPGGYSLHVEKLAGVSVQGWPKLELQAHMSSNPKVDHVQRLKLTVPNVKIVDGVEIPNKPSQVFVTMVTPYGVDIGVEQKRIFGLVKNILADAQSTGVFVDMLPRQ